TSSIAVGKARVLLPAGWRLVEEEAEVRIIRSDDGREQATITVIQFSPNPSFEDFERLCHLRLEAEKREMEDGFVQSDSPFKHGTRFGLFFSGADRKVGRLFSGYLVQKAEELITIYVEGVGVPPQDHLESFGSFVQGLKL